MHFYVKVDVRTYNKNAKNIIKCLNIFGQMKLIRQDTQIPTINYIIFEPQYFSEVKTNLTAENGEKLTSKS